MIQLVLVEAVLLAAALATGRQPLIVTIAAVLGVVVLAATLVRRHGRWWSESVLLWWRRYRRSAVRAPHADDRRLTALRTLAPDLSVATVEIPGDRAPIGVGSDATGWFAVAAILPPEEVTVAGPPAVPLEALGALLSETEQPGAVIQVLTHTVPAPTTALSAKRPCIDSYRELTRQCAPLPADQTVWVALRLDSAAAAVARLGTGHQDEDMPTATAMMVRRVGKRLKRAGLRHQILDADGLLDALVTSCDLDRHNSPAVAQEKADRWESARLSHRCFWLRDWPEPSASGPLLARLTNLPATNTSVAVILEPREDGIDVRCLTRIAVPQRRLAAATRRALIAAREAGGTLLPLDGELAPAVYATAPTGGGAR